MDVNPVFTKSDAESTRINPIACNEVHSENPIDDPIILLIL